MEEIIKKIQDLYLDESEVCMAELLADTPVPEGLTIEQAFELYVALMKWSDGDEFYTIKEGEKITL